MANESPRISRRSAWQAPQIEAFLVDARQPLRLACHTGSGFPSIGSLWFEYRDGSLWCASHESSAIVRYLREDPRCAIEVAPNDPPYHGVRGHARAELAREGAAALLERLIARYLGGRDPGLAAWLMSRADQEYAIRLRPAWLSAWDYRGRMAPADGGACLR